MLSLIARRSSRSSTSRPQHHLSQKWQQQQRITPSNVRHASALNHSSNNSFNSNNNSLVLPGMHNPFFRQVRWKRRDGHKAFTRERPPTRKQRKRYNRNLGKTNDNKQHGAPGSKAGVRREHRESLRAHYLNDNDDDDDNDSMDDEYGMEDALLDDMIGNSSHLTAQPTPEPLYLGHRHKRYFNNVAEQMEAYYQQQDMLLLQQQQEKNDDDEKSSKQGDDDNQDDDDDDLLVLDDLKQQQIQPPPTDSAISLALRAFRDRYGTKKRPIGLVRIMEHLITDIGGSGGSSSVPSITIMALLGEHSWTTLLTCCASPAEGRKLMAIMMDQQQQQRQSKEAEGNTTNKNVLLSSYSWSILVDLYAKAGDFAGCQQVHEEMLQAGVSPTLASYTSTISACAKVCANGRIAHSVRAQAGKVGWEAWQEMRVAGLEPDVMAYGAMIQLTGARGHPERALNLLEEMEQMEVKPTTLCFTNALRAVAKSHATAVRYERASSKKNRRREFVTSHHGKLAQNIVIRAENAQVVQDNGFVAALIMCAAAAGDMATAKSIFTASQVRSNLTELRTIGSDDHLRQLRGESSSSSADESKLLELGAPLGSANGSITTTPGYGKKAYPGFGEREHGKDSRALSAMLHACAKAVDKNGMGTIWQGRENKGYLCENSLRLIQARQIPEYVDNSIPGQSRTDALTWRGEHYDEDYRNGKRKQRKFSGVEEDPNVGTTLDELDDELERMYVDKDGRRKKEYQATSYDDIWKQKYGYEGLIDEGEPNEADPSRAFGFDDSKVEVMAMNDQAQSTAERKMIETEEPPKEEMYFDYSTMKWQAGPKPLPTPAESTITSFTATEDPEYQERELKPQDTEQEEQEELYFDKGEMKWKSRTRSESEMSKMTDFERRSLLQNQKTDVVVVANDDGFEHFFNELKEEIVASGDSPDDVTEEEARELFSSMKDEYTEFMNMAPEDYAEAIDNLDSDQVSELLAETKNFQRSEKKQDFQEFIEDIKDDWREDGPQASQPVPTGNEQNQLQPQLQPSAAIEQTQNKLDFVEDFVDVGLAQPSPSRECTASTLETTSTRSQGGKLEAFDNDELGLLTEGDQRIERLRALLPGLPMKRLRKIDHAFRRNLGDPSILDLALILREQMPDYVTNTWLKQASAITSRLVVQEAAKEGLIDTHMLNGVLEIECAAGSLDKALQFHRSEFGRHGLEPTDYSNRLVLQMLIKNNRFHRALTFKRQVEDKGQTLDIPSYGTLIQKSSRHGQLGSALLLLKECVNQHGAPPSEAYLKDFRILCKRENVTEELGLDLLIGKDPIAWLKHGETHYKREMSKKGRRMVLYPRNRLMQV